MQDGDGFKYWGFLSYSSKDSRVASTIFRRLETFNIPARLRGTMPLVAGRKTTKLRPLFRDREELSSSGDLGATLRLRLQESRCLLVVCSPQAAQSKWVNQEIVDFKRLGRGHQILTAIVAGEPHSEDPLQECFPPALRFQVDANGRITSEPELHEPIAADFREPGDGFENALIKLAAGLLEVGFDDLKRRHQAEQRQRVTLLTIGAIVLAGGVYGAIQIGTRGQIDSAVRTATADTRLRAERDRLGANAVELLTSSYGSREADTRLLAIAEALKGVPAADDQNQYLPPTIERVLRSSGLSILPTRILTTDFSSLPEDGPIPIIVATGLSCSNAANDRDFYRAVAACMTFANADRVSGHFDLIVHGNDIIGLRPTDRSNANRGTTQIRSATGFHEIPGGCLWTEYTRMRDFLFCAGEEQHWFFDGSDRSLQTTLAASLPDTAWNFRGQMYVEDRARNELFLRFHSGNILVFDTRQLAVPARDLVGRVCQNVRVLAQGAYRQLGWWNAEGGAEVSFSQLSARCGELGYEVDAQPSAPQTHTNTADGAFRNWLANAPPLELAAVAQSGGYRAPEALEAYRQRREAAYREVMERQSLTAIARYLTEWGPHSIPPIDPRLPAQSNPLNDPHGEELSALAFRLMRADSWSLTALGEWGEFRILRAKVDTARYYLPLEGARSPEPIARGQEIGSTNISRLTYNGVEWFVFDGNYYRASDFEF